MVLDHKRNEIGLTVFELLPFCFEDAFGLFEAQAVKDCKIVLDYLFCTMPNASFRRGKPNILPLYQVDITHRTNIDKILKPNIAEPQSLYLKADPLGIFQIIESYERILKTSLIDPFLRFLLIANMLDNSSLLQKVVIEITLQHEVVVVYFFQLSHQVFLSYYQLYHLLSYGFSNLFDGAFEEDLAIVRPENLAKIVENAFAGDGRDFARTSKYFNALADKQYFACSLGTHNRQGNELTIESIDIPTRDLNANRIDFAKLHLLLRLMHHLMYKKLILDINELSMGNPRNHLVQKNLLALLEYEAAPIFEPGVAFLECLPEDIDDDTAFVLFVDYFLDDGPELLHDGLVFAEFGSDVAEGEVAVI